MSICEITSLQYCTIPLMYSPTPCGDGLDGITAKLASSGSATMAAIITHLSNPNRIKFYCYHKMLRAIMYRARSQRFFTFKISQISSTF